jgi:hypothetical protein
MSISLECGTCAANGVERRGRPNHTMSPELYRGLTSPPRCRPASTCGTSVPGAAALRPDVAGLLAQQPKDPTEQLARGECAGDGNGEWCRARLVPSATPAGRVGGRGQLVSVSYRQCGVLSADWCGSGPNQRQFHGMLSVDPAAPPAIGAPKPLEARLSRLPAYLKVSGAGPLHRSRAPSPSTRDRRLPLGHAPVDPFEPGVHARAGGGGDLEDRDRGIQ